MTNLLSVPISLANKQNHKTQDLTLKYYFAREDGHGFLNILLSICRVEVNREAKSPLAVVLGISHHALPKSEADHDEPQLRTISITPSNAHRA
jgi:hypothetical protein